MAICSVCKEEKPGEDFKLDRGRKSGYSSWCRKCSNASTRRYHAMEYTSSKASEREVREAQSVLKSRVIPVILWDGTQAVQTCKFGDRRRLGHINHTLSVYEARNIDELIILDIEAHRRGRPIDMDAMVAFASKLYMPLAMGGGVNSLEIARELIRRCCDKVVVRSAVRGLGGSMLRNLSLALGSQAIVLAVDVTDGKVVIPALKYGGPMRYLDPVEFCVKGSAHGAGEIMLTSVNRQGTMTGYDIALIGAVCNEVTVPVIANGGAGTVEHMAAALNAGASAVAASTMFAFTEVTPRTAARDLYKKGFNMRMGS